VPVWRGLLPPLGFFASRLRPPRPLAIPILLIGQTVRERVFLRCGSVLCLRLIYPRRPRQSSDMRLKAVPRQ
jgi:hypothetical protein